MKSSCGLGNTVEALVDDILDDRLEEAVLLLVFLEIRPDEVVEMRVVTLQQVSLPGLPGTIYLYHQTGRYRKQGVSSNGITLKQVRIK